MISESFYEEPKLCIIGAGFAGLRAARHFEQLGVDYLLLEGSDRVGGRVYPFEYQNGFLHFGAEYVNGFDNEIYGIVEKLDLLDKFEPRTADLWMLDDGTVTVVDGKQVDRETLKTFHEFVKSLNETLYLESQKSEAFLKSVDSKIDENLDNSSIPDRDLFRKLCGIYKNYFQTEWSSPVQELSLSNLSLWDDGTDDEDSAVLNEYGFQKILEEFKSKIPKDKIRLNSKVININSENPDVKICLESGEILNFDAVIVTSSLGFLKAHHRSLFTPQLPRDKQEVIEKMGFGNNLKVFMEYETPWWSQDTSTIMITSEGQMNDFMVFQPSNWAENILTCWIAGSGPSLVAQLSDSELKNLLDAHLKHNLKSFHVESSVRIYRKNWISDEYALGSYSYLTPGQHGTEDIQTLGEPVIGEEGRPLVCFAGEHTDPTMYQTTVGAARSGMREAVRIMKAYFPCE
ncbi:hypothetical protein GCK72_021975 [Caenorhabditis remanei]|uniref:Amine oxidase domain-containing protein n=1 Tax=Caenorhabditis remanei TaxID=31234 RepID=A0A6A5GL98_CAERE|nr:hypothetical protein GCK72_021975 [Caenorhabditis remanei]KAF1755406.1 hypothetical protein GCK72_021975 [Caenorhabditis remanei]